MIKQMDELLLYKEHRLRDIYDETVKMAKLIKEDLNSSLGAHKWNADVDWDEEFISILVYAQDMPSEIDIAPYISIDIMPRPKVENGIGMSRRDLEVLRDNQNLMVRTNAIDYYEAMFDAWTILKDLI